MKFSVVLLLMIAERFCSGQGEIPGQYIVFFNDDSDQTVTRERLFDQAEQRQESQPPQMLLELRQRIAVEGLTEDEAREWASDESVARVVPVCILNCLKNRQLLFVFCCPVFNGRLTLCSIYARRLEHKNYSCSRFSIQPAVVGSRSHRSGASDSRQSIFTHIYRCWCAGVHI